MGYILTNAHTRSGAMKYLNESNYKIGGVNGRAWSETARFAPSRGRGHRLNRARRCQVCRAHLEGHGGSGHTLPVASILRNSRHGVSFAWLILVAGKIRR
jgi:hypothetical protein